MSVSNIQPFGSDQCSNIVKSRLVSLFNLVTCLRKVLVTFNAVRLLWYLRISKVLLVEIAVPVAAIHA